MKFTKEEFSEKLKEKLTNKGKKPMQQSERTFKKLVEKIYARLEKKGDDETELDDAVADYLEDFEEIEGNLNKDKADFIKDWKDKHPDPKPKTEPSGNGNEPPKDDDKYQKLLDKLDALEKKQAEKDKAEKIAEKRKELKSMLKKEGVDDADWLDGYLKKLHLDEDTDLDDEKDDALKLFNRTKASTEPNGTPSRGGGASSDEFQLDYLRKKKKD